MYGLSPYGWLPYDSLPIVPASGGSTFSASVSESATASEAESAAATFAAAAAEAAAASEAASSSAVFAGSESEAGSAGDAPAANAVFAASVTEAGAAADATDAALANQVYNVSVTEAAAAADTASATVISPFSFDTHDGRPRIVVDDDEPPVDDEPRHVPEPIRAAIERARARLERSDTLPAAQERAAETVVSAIEDVAQAAPELFVRSPLITDMLRTLETIGRDVSEFKQRTAIIRLRQIEQEIEDEQAAIMLLLAE